MKTLNLNNNIGPNLNNIFTKKNNNDKYNIKESNLHNWYTNANTMLTDTRTELYERGDIINY